MSSSKFRWALAGLALLSVTAWPSSADARGGGFAASVAPAAAPAMGGGMIGGGGSFGGGAAFAGFPTAGVTPNFSRFTSFPFFGGGAWGWGGPTVITQPLIMPPPAPPPQQVGPMQVNQTIPFGTAVVKSTRQIFVNGTPTMVTSPMVVDYHWPSGKMAAKEHRSITRARIRIRK